MLLGDASVYQPRTGEAAYYLAKGTISTLTRVLAVELADLNPSVRVNAILPGSVLPPESLTAEEREQRQQATLTQRADDPQAIADAVRYLSESPFITGQCLTLDGGRQILPQ